MTSRVLYFDNYDSPDDEDFSVELKTDILEKLVIEEFGILAGGFFALEKVMNDMTGMDIVMETDRHAEIPYTIDQLMTKVSHVMESFWFNNDNEVQWYKGSIFEQWDIEAMQKELDELDRQRENEVSKK